MSDAKSYLYDERTAAAECCPARSAVPRDIVDELPLAQSTVSQQLKVLKEAGLIRGEVDGPRVCYCIEPRVLHRSQGARGGHVRNFARPCSSPIADKQRMSVGFVGRESRVAAPRAEATA